MGNNKNSIEHKVDYSLIKINNTLSPYTNIKTIFETAFAESRSFYDVKNKKLVFKTIREDKDYFFGNFLISKILTVALLIKKA